MRIPRQTLINYLHCLSLLHFLVPQDGLTICWVNIRVVEPCVQGKWASLVAQSVKNLPAVRGTWVRSLGWEAPGEGSGNPLWYPCLENLMEPGGLRSMGSQRVGHD